MAALGWFAERILFADVMVNPVTRDVLGEEWFEILSIGLLFVLLLAGTVLGLIGALGRVKQSGDEEAKRADRQLAVAGHCLYAFCLAFGLILAVFITAAAWHYEYLFIFLIIAVLLLIVSLIVRLCRKKKVSFILYLVAVILMTCIAKDEEIYVFMSLAFAVGLAVCALGSLVLAILMRRAKSAEVRESSAKYRRYACNFGFTAGLAAVLMTFLDTYYEKTVWSIAGVITALCLWGLKKRKLAALVLVLTEALILCLYYMME